MREYVSSTFHSKKKCRRIFRHVSVINCNLEGFLNLSLEMTNVGNLNATLANRLCIFRNGQGGRLFFLEI